jgi:hypothetical protein
MDDLADVSSQNRLGWHLLDGCSSTRNRKDDGSPAPLRYAGVPPASRLGRVRTPDAAMRMGMWAPDPAGR